MGVYSAFALSVLGVAVLWAEEERLCVSSYYNYVTPSPPKEEMSTPSVDETPCECDPQPCYDLSFDDPCCNFGFIIGAEFLYWHAKEANLSYALEVNEKLQDALSGTLLLGPQSLKYLGSSWDPGLRLAVGFASECFNLDFELRWTWLNFSRRDGVSVPRFSTEIENEVGKTFILVPWMNQSFHRFTFALWDNVRAFWQLKINQFDFEIGQKYCVGSHFAIRPFTGLRLAYWNTEFKVTSYRDSLTISTDDFKNPSWGLGPVLGVQPTWYLTQCFAIYAGADLALLWGRHTGDKTERLQVSGTTDPFYEVDYKNSFSSKIYKLTTQAATELGVRFEAYWCDCRFRTTFDVGLEYQVLLDLNQRIETLDRGTLNPSSGPIYGFLTYQETTGNVGFGGLVIRGQFEF